MDEIETIEWEFISRIIINPSIIDAAGELVNGMHFQDKGRGLVFEGLCVMRNGGVSMTDPRVVALTVSKNVDLEFVGGISGFTRKVIQNTGMANISSGLFYASEIVRRWRLRKLREIASSILTETSMESADPTDIAMRCSMDIEMASAPEERFKGALLSEAIMECADGMEAQLEKGDESASGYKTGMETIDHTTGGFMPGELIILAARTSVGKTACAVGWAMHGAVNDKPTLIISMEMRQLQLAQRIIARELGLSAVDLRSGSYTTEDVIAVRNLGKQAEGVKLGLYNMRGASVSDIVSLARRWKYEHGLEAVIVDYLQLIEAKDDRRSRAEQVSKISGDLLSAADKLDVPIIALSQLNRKGEETGKPDPPPMLSNLRESGSIEQDAEIVMMLHRQREERNATIFMRKLRQGTLGEVALEYNGPRFKFDECENQNTGDEYL